MRNVLLPFLLIVFLAQTGCASFNRGLKALLSGNPAPRPQAEAPRDSLVKYSETSNLSPSVRRKYRRTTRETLEREALLGERAGSLWVMEGQGAYLFHQNIMRMIGDPIAVELEGHPKEQLVAKVEVIRDLLQKIEDRQKAMLRGPASERPVEGNDPQPGAPQGQPPAAAQAQAPQAEDPDFKVKNVPTRIVERTVDGNYRVKGDQPFLIKGREYKVIVTGVVKAEDFNDEGIPASRLLDPKFDIVSVKRSGAASL